MTAPVESSAAWTDEGRRVAGVLDAVGSALVIGRDPEAVALVALGAARAQAARRRVAVADLVGEVGPLQSLVEGDDPHGIADSFLYGVSLNKIARPADASGNLFILPSGSEAVAVDEIFRSDRWRRLATGFREVGALLLLVAHADTPGLDVLATSVEGVIVAGDAVGALPDAPPPLAVVAPRARRAQQPRPTGTTPTAPAAAQPAEPEPVAAAAAPANRAWMRWLTLAALAGIVAVALAYWLLPRTLGREGAATLGRPTAADSARRDSARADSVRRDSVARAAAQDSARKAGAPLAALTVANPADSANVTPFSVLLGSVNSAAGATDELRGSAQQAPSVIALTPVVRDGGTWYQIIVGAYSRREAADSLLAALQQRGAVGPQSGRVIRTPYALLLADRVPATDVKARVDALTAKNVPVYVMSRGDGTVALYAGAFELPQDAAWLARQLQSAGVTSTLVYRTGRSL